jgi:hypothetical protein
MIPSIHKYQYEHIARDELSSANPCGWLPWAAVTVCDRESTARHSFRQLHEPIIGVRVIEGVRASDSHLTVMRRVGQHRPTKTRVSSGSCQVARELLGHAVHDLSISAGSRAEGTGHHRRTGRFAGRLLASLRRLSTARAGCRSMQAVMPQLTVGSRREVRRGRVCPAGPPRTSTIRQPSNSATVPSASTAIRLAGVWQAAGGPAVASCFSTVAHCRAVRVRLDSYSPPGFGPPCSLAGTRKRQTLTGVVGVGTAVGGGAVRVVAPRRPRHVRVVLAAAAGCAFRPLPAGSRPVAIPLGAAGQRLRLQHSEPGSGLDVVVAGGLLNKSVGRCACRGA